MPASFPEQIDRLRTLARSAADHAHVPYSKRNEAAVILLADGSWVPGVRVESASFSLLIPSLMNALTTAYALCRKDVIAAVQSRPFSQSDLLYLQTISESGYHTMFSDVIVSQNLTEWSPVKHRLNPFLGQSAPLSPDIGIALARQTAAHAVVPESHFPVGCIMETGDGKIVPGANIEHPDWTRILCAERNALGTVLSYGITDVTKVYLSCLNDRSGTPCGACRQLLTELAPGSRLWMDRGNNPPEENTPEKLLPGSFKGDSLTH